MPVAIDQPSPLGLGFSFPLVCNELHTEQTCPTRSQPPSSHAHSRRQDKSPTARALLPWSAPPPALICVLLLQETELMLITFPVTKSFPTAEAISASRFLCPLPCFASIFSARTQQPDQIFLHNVVSPPALHVLTLSAWPAPAGCFPFLLVSVPWPAPARHQTPALIITTVSPADAHAARVASKLSGKPERCSLITVIMPRSPPPPPMPSTGSGVQARWWAPLRVCVGADPAWSRGRPACCPACQTCPSPSSS